MNTHQYVERTSLEIAAVTEGEYMLQHHLCRMSQNAAVVGVAIGSRVSK